MSRSVDRMRAKKHRNIIGDDAYGPLSPEDLSKLDRALTPAEQQAVDDWQASQAAAALAAERAKGGPQSATVSVTPHGTTIQAVKAAPKQNTHSTATNPVHSTHTGSVKESPFPWWQVGLGSVGVLVIGFGLYSVLKKPKR